MGAGVKATGVALGIAGVAGAILAFVPGASQAVGLGPSPYALGQPSAEQRAQRTRELAAVEGATGPGSDPATARWQAGVAGGTSSAAPRVNPGSSAGATGYSVNRFAAAAIPGGGDTAGNYYGPGTQQGAGQGMTPTPAYVASGPGRAPRPTSGRIANGSSVARYS